MTGVCPLDNGIAVRSAAIPILGVRALFDGVVAACEHGRLLALRGHAVGGRLRLWAVTDTPELGLGVACADVGASYPSLTPQCPAAHLFERELAETWGVTPVGHPNLEPVRFVAPRDGAVGHTNTPEGPAVMPFYRVEGDVHEVAVGPVHAGVIEPGHFRFQCHGEIVLNLEIALGFQHRGIEAHVAGGPHERTLFQMETAAGDTTIGHATAYCQAIEGLAGTAVPSRAQAIRAIALELERLANHAGDLGALAGDVGFLPTASFCGRLRGDWLNATAAICGSRFGRGLVVPGGVRFEIEEHRAESLLRSLAAAGSDTRDAIRLLWRTPSVMARFDKTGRVSTEDARALGLVGVAARASGLPRDVRAEFPTGHYAALAVEPAVEQGGDVLARARVRDREVEAAISIAGAALRDLPEGPLRAPVGPLAADHFVVSLAEGWRGEVCHVAATDDDGRIAHYAIVDPSFHNWTGLSMALRNQQISDFPLCNKSFNLSYCGHDL